MTRGSRDDPPSERPAEGRESIGDREGVGRTDRQVIFDGRVVKLNVDSVRFPDGRQGTLELVTHPGASAVIPFLDPPTEPDARIVLVDQYRYAAGGRLYEVPAGIPDSHAESWVDCARRELTEETGFEAGELRYLTRIFTTPGFTDEVIHLFAAMNLTPGSVDRDEDEYIEVVPMPLSEALDAVRTGRIVDGKSVVALLFASTFLSEVWEENRLPPTR